MLYISTKNPYTRISLITMFCLGCCIQLFGPWGCRERWQFFRSWGRRVRSCVMSVHLKKITLILITFNRWFYWRWNTCRKWVGDPTTYVVEYFAKWRRLRWFLCRNLRTISVSQDETHCRGYYRPPWLHSSSAWSRRVSPLAYWV